LDQSITKDIYDKKHKEYQDQTQVFEIEMTEHSKADYEYQTTMATVIRKKAIFELLTSEPNCGRKKAIFYYSFSPQLSPRIS